MSQLKSKIYTVTDSAIEERSVSNAKSIMPLDGTIRVWYGRYSGTPAQLQAEGMPIAAGALLEHVMLHAGVVSIISTSGDITVHEVI